VPDSPRAWLIQVAQRRMTDHVRSEIARRNREARWLAETDFVVEPSHRDESESARIDHDDLAVLLFMCCHPALTPASAIALTLRAVGGLTTAEIANAFLVPEATMAQRISRAKQTSRTRASVRMPRARTRGAARRGPARALPDLQRGLREQHRRGPAAQRPGERGDPAHARGRTAAAEDSEVAGLLALMLLTDARRRRARADGELIRSTSRIARLGPADSSRRVALSARRCPRARRPYQLQAAIAAVHDEAARAEDTDWPQILALYGC
jgi:predicted RNA polymerase sigma factor